MSKALVPEISGTAVCKTRILGPNRLMMTDGHPGPGHRAAGSCQQFPSSAGTQDAHTPAAAWVTVIRPCQGRWRPQAGDPLTRRSSSSSLPGRAGPRAGQVPGRICQAVLQAVLLHLTWPDTELSEEGCPFSAPQIRHLGSSGEAGQKCIKAAFTDRLGSEALRRVLLSRSGVPQGLPALRSPLLY